VVRFGVEDSAVGIENIMLSDRYLCQIWNSERIICGLHTERNVLRRDGYIRSNCNHAIYLPTRWLYTYNNRKNPMITSRREPSGVRNNVIQF